MMRKGNRVSILLVEILVATLFFSLASTVILRVYATTRRQAVFAETGNSVQTEVQNLSEECCAADDPVEVLTAYGFRKVDGEFVYQCSNYTICAVIEEENTGAGTLRCITFSASIGSEKILTLPSARYMPEVSVS